MKTRLMAVLGGLAIFALGSAAFAGGLKLEGPAKPAYIYFSQPNDGGWTQSFDDARLQMQTDLGIEIPYVEGIGDNAIKIRAAAERLIQRGYNIIIGTSFGYNDTFKALSEENPHVAFLNAPGTVSSANLQPFYGRSYESYYLCGIAAGAMSKSGKLGFVGAMPTQTVLWNINSFLLGARTENPKATLNVVYTGSWDDPSKEKVAASALLDAGADVIGEHINGPTPELAAQTTGKYAVGFQRDKSGFAPKSTICSAAWSWAGYLTAQVKKIESGTWEVTSSSALPGIAGGGTDDVLGKVAMPAPVVDKIKETRTAIMDGKTLVFAGPITDNNGKERVAGGQVLSDKDLWAMDWYVEGVTAQK